MTLPPAEANPPWAACFSDGKRNRENPILELRLDIVGIDGPGESDRAFKLAVDDFPREPVVSLTMPVRLTLLGGLRLLCLLSSVMLLRLRLALLLL